MARPRADSKDQKRITIGVRVTAGEARRLERLAHDLHLRGRADGSISGTVRALVTDAWEAFKTRKVKSVARTLDEP